MTKVWKIAALACGLLLMSNVEAHAKWLDMGPTSTIPFTANLNSALGYTIPCRVNFAGGVHPGWTGPGLFYCAIGWGGQELKSGTYQVWVDDWEPASNGNVPANAIPLGFEANAPTIQLRYACYATAPNGLPTSGKVGTNLGACNYPWGNVEERASSYNVLVDSALGMVESTGGPKLTVNPIYAGMTGFTGTYSLWESDGGWGVADARVDSGIENDGSYLTFCTAYYADGYHPGKMSWRFGGCNISFGGVEINLPDANTELVMNWQPTGGGIYSNGYVPIDVPIAYNASEYPGGLFQSAVIGGQEADGTHFYLCAAVNDRFFYDGPVYSFSRPYYIPGKLRPGLGGCSIGANGIENIVPNYQVLVETYTKPAP